MKPFFAGIFLLLVIPGLWANGSTEPSIPESELEPGLYARMITSAGEMVFILDYEKNQLAVTSFAGLAKGVLDNSVKPSGVPYFDGMTFYHLVPNYAVFCGDPDANGKGGPGYTLPLNPEGLYSAGSTGTLVMDGLPRESAGSRFFITIDGDSFLDTKYMRFGQLVYGEKVLRKLKIGDILQSIEILQIGVEFESLYFGSDLFRTLLQEGREAEIAKLEAMDPELGKNIRELEENRQRTESGTFYRILVRGSGPKPVAGDKVAIHYTGSLTNGIIFDSSRNRGQVFSIVLGQDGIIPGWIEMIADMRAGETRRVIIPPELAYGDREFGPIPANSWLIFEMELVEIS